MKNNRRNFLKKTSLAGLGLVGASIKDQRQPENREPFFHSHRQTFNMSGYAAPKLDVVRVGIMGLGMRGSGTVRRFASIEGVEIKALCDLVPDRVTSAIEQIRPLGQNPDSYSGGEDEWRKVCERPDIDLIVIVTPWHLHVPQSLCAMENGKHVYTELPAANTIEECWQLVETSERTRKHLIQMSGSSHRMSYFEAAVLSMVRQGFFGDIVHAEGAYIHDLLRLIISKRYQNIWRLDQNTGRHGNLYPQHGLVPIIQMMDINCGDKMEFLTSVSSDDFMMDETIRLLAAEDDFWKPYIGRGYRGNMNTSVIRTNKGRTIMIQHDVTSPRPDIRFNLISGTKGTFQASPRPSRISTGHSGWVSQEEFESLIDKYTPEITKRFNEQVRRARQIDRSRGYSTVNVTDWRVVDCLLNGLPMDQDVYEAAVSSAITPLSEWSVANRSNSVTIPDFTSGAWKTNQRSMDIELSRGGGTTGLL
jgi:hypothetical protein